jgi:hypothetical protein
MRKKSKKSQLDKPFSPKWNVTLRERLAVDSYFSFPEGEATKEKMLSFLKKQLGDQWEESEQWEPLIDRVITMSKSHDDRQEAPRFS